MTNIPKPGTNLEEDIFSELDRHFANFIIELSGSGTEELMLAALLVSSRTGRGDICVNIPEIAGKRVSNISGVAGSTTVLPGKTSWVKTLRSSTVIGSPGDYRPLILDGQGRLYLYRYWEYEQILANNVSARINKKPPEVNLAIFRDSIERLFPKDKNEEVDWQRVAACAAVIKGFYVVSGGPGTGKTSTVIKILALLLEQAQARGLERSIALAAPTGKAAARLKESISQSLKFLNCSDAIKKLIPDETFTIHRLLGSREGSPYFRYHADNQLPHGIVVVDESSMADLALMSKLFQAVPVSSHFILLGDRDQLASVESGAVLGDICDTGSKHGYSQSFAEMVKQSAGESVPVSNGEPAIADSIIILGKSYRFGSNSGVSAVSQAVKRGDADAVIRLLKSKSFADIDFIEHSAASSLSDALARPVMQGYEAYLREREPFGAFKLFSGFSLLCALRHGPWGVETVNEIVERILMNAHLIQSTNRWYAGRPVMVTRNDYGIRLFNGDVGMILPDATDSSIQRVYFPSADGTFRKILPLQLPEHETAYAITVHKSQGSEFDRVLVLLPDRESPVLSRELLYTAMTRARKKVEIWGTEKILRFMINHPNRRTSGLRDALWG